jgi:asparagine synthase (glutamine-hydrolysing)
MCGIFGIKFVDGGRPVDRQMVVTATDLMTHRGPDDSGYWVQGSLGLGHRRLSIIDLSPLGHQPMFNEDGRIALVYNGEIYNYLELYQPLFDKGHHFKSKSDTEVIIHSYEEYGYDCLHQFNGMFSFGLWDEKRQSLWVVRDRLGVKPLYYYWDGNIFIFSSEIKPILETGYVKAEMNESVLDAYFSLGYVPGPETMFKNIKKVMPGHYLSLKDGCLTDTEYWDFAEIETTRLSESDCLARLEELLQDSVRMRLRSDVPLGVFLSGGLDSSAVVALMSQIVSEPINTYTVGYDKAKNFSEEPFAELIAKQFGTKHNVFRLEPDDFLASVEKLVHFSEEPIVEPAAIALFHISKLARGSATVLLSGEGSDEIFAGYYLYDFMGKIDQLQQWIPPSVLKLGRLAVNFSGKTKFRKYADWLCQPLSERYQGTSSYLTDSLKRDLYSQQFYLDKGDYLSNTFSNLFGKVAHKPDSLGKMLYVDTKTWLVDDLLIKADKMTMAASIELRVPFLDYRLVEFAASLPSALKLNHGNGKSILKSTMKNKLPDSIVSRKKMGFPVPVNNWFSNDLFNSISDNILESKIIGNFNNDKIRELLIDHKKEHNDNSKSIMTLLVLSEWHKRYIG